jgi:hypothetical protein
MPILLWIGVGFMGGMWVRSEADSDEEGTGSRIGRNAMWAAAAVAGVWLWMRKR